ncbi:MAG: leucine-rich repeat domain-containing protein [Oscillospiraceae bacterium]|nr:leucine-rich repeat domain-containing protein [Oscillospiraceae bacterium]
MNNNFKYKNCKNKLTALLVVAMAIILLPTLQSELIIFTTSSVPEHEYITIAGEQFRTTATSVTLDGRGLTSADLEPLNALTNLRELSLNNNQIRDISFLSNFSNLETISLNNNQISNVSVFSNTEFHRLWQLFLDNNQISELPALSGITNIMWMSLNNNQIGSLTAFGNVSLPRLTVLALSYNQLENVAPLTAGGFGALGHLHLDNNRINNISSFERANFVNLEFLALNNNQISNITGLSRATLPDLLWLNISSNHLDTDNTATIAALASLRQKIAANEGDFFYFAQNPPLGSSYPENQCGCRNCYDCGFHGGKFGFGYVNNGSDITIADALQILRYLVNLPNVIDDCDDARAAANIINPGLGSPTIADARAILAFLVGIPSALDNN